MKTFSATLLDQHCEQIQTNTTLKVDKWTSESDDNEFKDKFANFIKENDVVVVNAQVLLDALNQNIIDESMFALVVIDECHHCLGLQHPYQQLAKKLKTFKKNGSADSMRIIGLTSCGLNTDVEAERISERIVLLENIMGAKIISSDSLIQNSKYLNKPKELIIFYSKNFENDFNFSELFKLEIFLHSLGDFDNPIDPRGFVLDCIKKITGVMEDCGIYCAYHVAQNCIKMTEKFLNQNLNQNNLMILSIAVTTFRNFCIPLQKTFSRCNSYEKILPYLSRQVVLILEALETFNSQLNPKVNPLTAIIFLERKSSVLALCVSSYED